MFLVMGSRYQLVCTSEEVGILASTSFRVFPSPNSAEMWEGIYMDGQGH